MKNNEEDKKDEGSEEEITQLTPDEDLEAEEKGTATQAPAEDQAVKLKEMEDRYLRTYADFENFKKRVAKEKEELALRTSERLLKELLEVKDHLEMALSHAKDAKEVKGLREGVNLTLKQLGKFLEKFGVTESNPIGEPFDPAFHEAIHQEESAEYKPGTIVHVYQKGYLFHGRLLRPARVTVAREKS